MNAVASVRELFEEALPRAFAFVPARGEGLTCRFHVGAAGAWSISLGAWVGGPSCIDAKKALGGYHAVVYVSEVEFEALGRRETTVAALRASPTFTLEGDAERAAVLLEVLATSPLFRSCASRAPDVAALEAFAWPEALRRECLPAAFFRASKADLERAFRHTYGSGMLAPPFAYAIAPVSDSPEDLGDFFDRLKKRARRRRRGEGPRPADARPFSEVVTCPTAFVLLVPDDIRDLLASNNSEEGDSPPIPTLVGNPPYEVWHAGVNAGKRRQRGTVAALAQTAIAQGESLWFWSPRY